MAIAIETCCLSQMSDGYSYADATFITCSSIYSTSRITDTAPILFLILAATAFCLEGSAAGYYTYAYNTITIISESRATAASASMIVATATATATTCHHTHTNTTPKYY